MIVMRVNIVQRISVPPSYLHLTAIEQQKQYNEEVSGLKSWLAEVDVFLKAEEAALGDVETLEAQLEQSSVSLGIGGCAGLHKIRVWLIYFQD